MASGVFLIQADGQLVEMSEENYRSEADFQELLAKYPNLLAGNQINDTQPRRWLLISREAALPSGENGSDRWSVDHLFLDQDAIPTLVEVKRSKDTRIRREVVGQMLDYAANAVVYWPVEEIRAKFDATCQAIGLNSEDELGAFLGPSEDSDAFWQKTKTNLQAGKIRMLFVADSISKELLKRLNQIPGVEIPENAMKRRPKIFLSTFRDASSLSQLLETLEWVVQEIKFANI